MAEVGEELCLSQEKRAFLSQQDKRLKRIAASTYLKEAQRDKLCRMEL